MALSRHELTELVEEVIASKREEEDQRVKLLVACALDDVHLAPRDLSGLSGEERAALHAVAKNAYRCLECCRFFEASSIPTTFNEMRFETPQDRIDFVRSVWTADGHRLMVCAGHARLTGRVRTVTFGWLKGATVY